MNVKIFLVLFFLGIAAGCVSPEQEVDILIPVDIVELPAGFALDAPHGVQIEIRVRGREKSMAKLSLQNLRYCVALSDFVHAKIGLNEIPVSWERIDLPKGISIIKKSSSSVFIRLDGEIQKTLTVEIKCKGEAASGYRIVGLTAKPAIISVRGTRGVLSQMTHVGTKPVELAGRSESFKKETALEIPEGVEIKGSSKLILAEITLEEKILNRKIEGIQVLGTGAEGDYTITPSIISVEVKGPRRIINDLVKGGKIAVSVDLKGLKPGIYVRRAVISLPVDVVLLGVKPENFTITILSMH